MEKVKEYENLLLAADARDQTDRKRGCRLFE
jgi:hypothetical protein